MLRFFEKPAVAAAIVLLGSGLGGRLCVVEAQDSAQGNLLPLHCTGVFEIADLTVTPHLVATTQVADAKLPSDTALNWDKANVVTLNAKRAEVSLNGIWHFIPAGEAMAEPPKAGWASIKVPGS